MCCTSTKITLILLRHLRNSVQKTPFASFKRFSKEKTHSTSFVEHQRQVARNLFIDLQLATRKIRLWGSAPNTDWQSNPLHPQMDPYSFQQPGNLNPQVQPFRPAAPPHRLAHQPSRGSNLKRQITDQLVAPADVLDYDRPVKKKSKRDLTSQGMDKRHPSSFQQLEKVHRSHSRRIEKLLTSFTAGRGNLCNSMNPLNQSHSHLQE